MSFEAVQLLHDWFVGVTCRMSIYKHPRFRLDTLLVIVVISTSHQRFSRVLTCFAAWIRRFPKSHGARRVGSGGIRNLTCQVERFPKSHGACRVGSGGIRNLTCR